jgi:hypothetical protein
MALRIAYIAQSPVWRAPRSFRRALYPYCSLEDVVMRNIDSAVVSRSTAESEIGRPP